jgi:hypothetical protein
MKVCTGCKFHRYHCPHDQIPDPNFCIEGLVPTVDPVTGEAKLKAAPTCRDMRAKGGRCGPEGDLFEAAPPPPTFKEMAQAVFDELGRR